MYTRRTTTADDQLHSKADVLAVLRRAGLPAQQLRSLADALEDPVDLRRDANVFLRYGITLDRVIDRLGGSP
jgi:crotonobetainyl-CoA:carnitine CoA-transferase CaiB-like acyl-CoA transferase